MSECQALFCRAEEHFSQTQFFARPFFFFYRQCIKQNYHWETSLKIHQFFLLRNSTYGISLDISRAFDKVWHDGVIFKLCHNGISGDIINILQDFLRNRKERIVLNGLKSECKLFADDTSVFSVVHDTNISTSDLNET